MIIRETTQKDIDYMNDHSLNHKPHQTGQTDYIFTLEHKVPLMVGGFRIITPSTYWCWVDLSVESKKHIPEVYRVMKEWIEKFVVDYKITRLQAYVRPNFDEAIRLVKHLGFKKESTMEKFFGEQDAFMYVRIGRPNGNER